MIHTKDKIHKTLLQVYEDVLHAENKFKISTLKNAIVIGLVIDASTPKKTRTNEYMQQIKIIDQTINFGETSDHPKYLHIFLFSNLLDDLLTINNLGDVIYMKRFEVTFCINSSQLLLQATKNKFHTSKIMLISGQISGPTLIKQVKPDKFSLSQLTSDDECFIGNLKEWGLSYFSQYPISQQSWREQSKENEYYDLLLRVTNIQSTEHEKVKKVTFENNHAEIFTMMIIEDEDLKNNIQIGQVIKLRNTKICLNNELQPKESSILFIPNYFHDSAQFVNLYDKQKSKIVNLNKNFQREQLTEKVSEEVTQKTNKLSELQGNMVFEGQAEIYDCSHKKNGEQHLLIMCLRDESLERSEKFITALIIIKPDNLAQLQKMLNLEQNVEMEQQLDSITQRILEESLNETVYNFEIHQIKMNGVTLNKIVKFNNELFL